MAFIDPDEVGFIDPDEIQPQKKPDITGRVAAYQKYSQEYDSTWAKPPIPGHIQPKKMTEAEFNEDRDSTIKDRLAGVPDAALSFLTSIPAMVAAGPAAMASSAFLGENTETAFNRILEQNTWTPRTDSGKKYMESLGYALQPFGLAPYLAPRGPIRAVGGPKKPKITTPEKPPVDWKAVQEKAQAAEVPEDLDFWKKRAEELHQEALVKEKPPEVIRAQEKTPFNPDPIAGDVTTMEALARSQEGHVPNQIPPDGVVPRDALFFNKERDKPMLQTPRDQTWVVDENGIPVRQNLPESTVAPDYINHYMRQDEPVRNDLGNAIQEANGPKLGPDEHWGSEPLAGPHGAPEPPALGKGVGGKQRGGVDVQAIYEALKKPLKDLTDFVNVRRTMDSAIKYGPEPTELEKARYFSYETKAQKAQAQLENTLAKHGLVAGNRVKIQGIEEPQLIKEVYSINGEPVVVTHPIGKPNETFPHSLDTVHPYGPLKGISRGPGGKQRGVLNVGDIAGESKRLLRKLEKPIPKIDYLTPEEKVLVKTHAFDENYIPKGPEAGPVIEAIKAAGKGQDGQFFKNLQSGLLSAAEKIKSPLLQHAGRWMARYDKLSDKSFRDIVKPLEGAAAKLKWKELTNVMEAMKTEQFGRRRFTDAELVANMSEKELTAYRQLRGELDKFFVYANKVRESIGKPPITPEEAYFASMNQGDFVVKVVNDKGRPLWYSAVSTVAEQRKAAAWLKTQFNPEWVQTHSRELRGNLPRETGALYKALLDVFADTPMEAELREAMANFQEHKAYTSGGFYHHFDKKSNVRGFLGDRPWNSAKDNALSAAKSQIDYLRHGYRWAHFQEAVHNINEVLRDKDVQDLQPNNVALIKAYVNQTAGITDSAVRTIENYLARSVPSFSKYAHLGIPWGDKRYGVAFGHSGATLKDTVASLKSITYLKNLSLSTGYAIATPLQALVLGPSLHRQLSAEGYKWNTLESTGKALTDASIILMAHAEGNFPGTEIAYSHMSDFGRKAMKYAEDNGVISVTMFDEHASLGGHRSVDAVKTALGWTISTPEKIARTTTFMSFVHHLKDSGKYANDIEVFRAAEEMTDATLTNFRRTARPLVVGNLGAVGDLAYTYKSPIFNLYNQMSAFARHGKRTGDWTPLALALGATYMFSGMMGMPGMTELDQGFELLKDAASQTSPRTYDTIKGISIRGWAMENTPDWNTYGALSDLLGVQMASRFSAQIADISNPIANASPVFSTVKDLLGAGSNLLDPTKTNVAEAAYKVLPPAPKGILQTEADAFKSGHTMHDDKGTLTGYRKPTDLESGKLDMYRTPEQEFKKKFGLTDMGEYRHKEERWLSGNEARRNARARQEVLGKIVTAIQDKNKFKRDRNIQLYLSLGGGDNLDAEIEKAMQASVVPQEMRQAMAARTRADIIELKKRMARGMTLSPRKE